MTEQIKIMEMINHWGYLNLEQIALLLNKNKKTVESQLSVLVKKKLITADKLTRKNIYVLSSSGNYHFARHAHQIKINFNELKHQDILIKWLTQQNNIDSYLTEREIKMENGNLNGYPDLVVYKNDNSCQVIELERTRKAPDRFIKKLDSLQEYYKQGICVHWITLTPTLSNWIKNQINTYAWEELNTHEIWNNKE